MTLLVSFLRNDALCINQNDDQEKSEQVQGMSTIYESARQAWIWLGTEFEGVEESFAWLRGLYQSSASSFEEINALLTPLVARALSSLLSLPWWRRVWIIQEATVSRDAVVICGNHRINFNYFMTLPNLMGVYIHTGRVQRQDSLYSLLMPAANDLLSLAELRSGWSQGRGANFMPLEAILRRTYLRVLATDPRDRFYALLGISTPQDMVALKPDYKMNRDAVFLKATLHLIRKTSSLDILQLGEDLQHAETDPSWLPGWDQKPYNSGPREIIKGYASQGIEFSLTTSDDLRTLTVAGAVISKILWVSKFEPEEHKFAPPSCISRWLEYLNNISQAVPDPYQSTCSLKEAFARSLVAGNPSLVPETDTFDSLLCWNFFSIWLAMTDPQYCIPNGCQRLQESRPGNVFDPMHTPAATFRRHSLAALHRRSFVITVGGHIGLAPDEACEGDVVALIGGSSTPVCMRPENGHFKWSGAAYLHGLMHGDSIRSNTTKLEIH